MTAGEGMTLGIFPDEWVDVQCFIRSGRVIFIPKERKQDKGDTRDKHGAPKTFVMMYQHPDQQ